MIYIRTMVTEVRVPQVSWARHPQNFANRCLAPVPRISYGLKNPKLYYISRNHSSYIILDSTYHIMYAKVFSKNHAVFWKLFFKKKTLHFTVCKPTVAVAPVQQCMKVNKSLLTRCHLRFLVLSKLMY